MKSYIPKITSLFLVALMVASCGFEPMYSRKSNVSNAIPNHLSQIAISIIPDKEGQALRNNLIDRLYSSGYPTNPNATLSVSKINEVRTELDLTKSSEATRAQLRLQSTMILTDKNGVVLLSHPIQSITSFNILGSEFATRVTEENARQSGLNELARQIELNLSLFYNSK